MTPANPRRRSVRLLETFSLEVWSCQKVDDQVCTASFHEVLVDHFLPALSTALASILAEVECTTDCCYGHVVGEWYETLFEGSTVLVFESMCDVDEVLQ